MTAPTTATPSVTTEDDATPMVLSVARTLRASARHTHLAQLLGSLEGAVGLRSGADPQAATIRYHADGAEVVHGIDAEVTAVLTVDVSDAFRVESVDGGDEVAEIDGTRRLLDPPLPDWQDAARRFWELTAGDPGMPDELVITCTDDGSRLVLGGGSSSYEIAASGEKLARILSGVDVFLYEVMANTVTIRGSLAQMSVMAGASWKVQFYA